jgi:hypothetical protein
MTVRGKSRPPPGFHLRTVQNLESRYTDWAIPTPSQGLAAAPLSLFQERPSSTKLVYCFPFPLASNGGFALRNTRVGTRAILNLIYIKLLHERVHNLVNVFRKEAKIFFMIVSTIGFSRTTLQHAFTSVLFPTNTTPSPRSPGSHYGNTEREKRSCKWRKLQLPREGAKVSGDVMSLASAWRFYHWRMNHWMSIHRH